MGGKDPRILEEEKAELKRQHDFMRFRITCLRKRVTDAFSSMIFSYQFFEEDRKHYQELRSWHATLDRELAEVDGRYKKVKSKLGPFEHRPKLQTMNKEKLKSYINDMDAEEKQAFFEALTKEVEK